jgi:hypothetical protein
MGKILTKALKPPVSDPPNLIKCCTSEPLSTNTEVLILFCTQEWKKQSKFIIDYGLDSLSSIDASSSSI